MLAKGTMSLEGYALDLGYSTVAVESHATHGGGQINKPCICFEWGLMGPSLGRSRRPAGLELSEAQLVK